MENIIQNSLAVIKQPVSLKEFAFDLSGITDVFAEILEAQSEVGGTVTYRAKVAAGGSKIFEISTGDEDMDANVSSIHGVVIHSHQCNTYFDEENSGSPPICSSLDGLYGVNRESNETNRCEDCPMNQYGSSSKNASKGKACKNMIRLYILTEGSPIPLVLSLPPTSLKSWRNYRLATLAPKRLKPIEVVTEFTLTSETSSSGNKYSVVKPKLKGRLPDEMLTIASFFAQGFKSNVAISADDYTCGNTTSQKDGDIDE